MIADEYSKFKVVKFLRAKCEALERFQDLIAKQGIPKILKSDNVEEFSSEHFKWYCIENKSKQNFTVPETPE